MGFPGGARVKNPPANAGDIRDVGSIPGSRRSPGGGHGNPLQYSFLENLMDRSLGGNIVGYDCSDLACNYFKPIIHSIKWINIFILLLK